jgi:hypothetical protein
MDDQHHIPSNGEANSSSFATQDADSLSDYDDLQEAVDNYYERLIYRMKLTRGARYQAARRHQRRSSASLWAVIFLSLYVFSSNVVIVLYGSSLSANLIGLFGFTSIVMSAFIIAFSVLESGHKHDLKSELFLRNAQQIGTIHDRADYEFRTKIADRVALEEIGASYNKLVNEFHDNHIESDFKTFRISIGKEKGKPIANLISKLKYYFDCWGIMWASIVFPPIFVFVGRQVF